MSLSRFFSRVSLSLLLGCAYVGSISFGGNANRADANEVQTAAPLPALLAAPHSARTTDSIKRNEVYAQTIKLFAAKDFDGLDALASSLRKDKGAYLNGSWWIDTFYKAIDSEPRTNTDEAWQQRIAQVQEWADKKPESVTARVSLAMLWKSYAWKARGGGWSNTVSDAMWKMHFERLAHCSEEIKKAETLKESCPVLYRLQMILIMAVKWDAAKEKQVFDASVKKYPTYLTAYGQHFTSLLPRWHGEPGDSEKIIDAAVSKLKGKEADRVYTHLVWAVDTSGTGLGWNLFTDTKLSYPRCKAGLTEMLKEAPDNLDILSELAQLADYAGDKDTARAAFQKLDNQYSSLVFRSKDAFAAARAHAYSSKMYTHS